MANYNENQINSNETERIIAEKQRINNEDKRQTNETEREASEVTRQTNETEREAREATRQSNESTRITEYNTFMADVHNNEDERIANEEGRVQAEASRVTAEQNRVTRFNEMEAIVSGVDVDITELQNDVDVLQNDMAEYLPLSGGTITGDLSANCFESTKTVESADGGGTIGSTTKTQIFTDQYGQGRFLIGNNSTDTPLVFIANPHDRSYSVNGDFTPAGGTSLKLGSDMNRWSSLYCNAANFGDKKTISNNNGILYITASNMEFFFQNDSDSAFPCFRPQENNIHLGHTSHRWNTLYLVNNPNVSSDRVMKENIEYIGKSKSELTYEDMYDFIKDDLGLATYNFIGDDKLRMNFIAQDLLVNADGTDSKVGQMIVNPVPVPTEEEIAEGKPYPTLSYDMGMYISVLAGALKEAINKIEQLEARINELENKNEEK